jgi:hypothetical protein
VDASEVRTELMGMYVRIPSGEESSSPGSVGGGGGSSQARGGAARAQSHSDPMRFGKNPIPTQSLVASFNSIRSCPTSACTPHTYIILFKP